MSWAAVSLSCLDDGFLQMHHAGELTKSEKAILKAILHKLGWSNLLVRRNYEAATGTTIGKALPSRVNLVTGEVA